MYGRYFTLYNNVRDRDAGVMPVSRPNIPTANEKTEEVEISGMDGKYYRSKGVIEDIEIPIKYNFISKDAEDWAEDFRRVKKWFRPGNGKLAFSDDKGYFYKVKKITIDTTERVAKRLGRFTATFTCEGYIYITEGQDFRTLNSTLYNAFEVSKPTYEITGNGVCTFTVNGVENTANIGSKLIINTELGLCYTELKETANRRLTGYYEDMYLREGENTFSITPGFTVKILPNWRCR